METRRYPTILLGQLIERLDDLSLRRQGIDHQTCKTLADIAEAMENQFRIWDVSDPTTGPKSPPDHEQWAFLDRMRDAADEWQHLASNRRCTSRNTPMGCRGRGGIRAAAIPPGRSHC